MASEIKANKISPATGTAFTIGDSGDTFTLPSGATLAVASGATISNAGTASGFGKIVQYVIQPYTTQTSTTVAIPYDGSIPQNTEGTEVVTASITPTSASNKLLIEWDIPLVGASNTAAVVFAMFQDSTADALTAANFTVGGSTWGGNGHLRHYMTAGTTSATTFKIRYGVTGTATVYLNRWDTTIPFGATAESILRITEFAV
jgi:hypothetical protein